MIDTSTEARYLIRKGGGFYRPNCKGYTSSVIQAGRYTLEEAERETHPNGPDGPRDGMSYLHEDYAISDDWDSYSALVAERDAMQAALEQIAEGRFSLMPAPDYVTNPLPSPQDIARSALAKAKEMKQ